ncbi:hypothetical protein HAX54_013333, partial [Datura stramonium]|nr:hypothetical protein [Datura stramonium]
ETIFGRLITLAASPEESAASKAAVRLPTRWKESCCACAVALKEGCRAPHITLNVLRIARSIAPILGRLAPACTTFLLPRRACCSARTRLPHAAYAILVRLVTSSFDFHVVHSNFITCIPKASSIFKFINLSPKNI